jgi:hypothetical protein
MSDGDEDGERLMTSATLGWLSPMDTVGATAASDTADQPSSG